MFNFASSQDIAPRLNDQTFPVSRPLRSTPTPASRSFTAVGSGEAADRMAATSARPSEPLVQFSRKRLSPD